MKRRHYYICFIMICCIVFLLAGQKDPVLLNLNNHVLDSHGFQILNPFRNRKPEIAAIGFLERLKRGDCVSLLEELNVRKERINKRCYLEKSHPLKKWRLEAIGYDHDGIIIFRFRVFRNNGTPNYSKGPFWIWTKRSKDSKWHVIACDTYY